MGDTQYTDDSWEENLPGLTTKHKVDLLEAKGFARLYEQFIPKLEINTSISISLILEIHTIALGEVYSWAGKWRISTPTVGSYLPPEAGLIPSLMAEYAYYVNQKIKGIQTEKDLAITIAYAHHRLVWVHPFVNGNGRTARVISDLIALLNGYKPISLYHREGDARNQYVEALQAADKYNYKPLEDLILANLSS